MTDLRPFRCPTCGSMLGKSDGTTLEAPCHRCKTLKLVDLRAAMRDMSRTSTLVTSGKA